MAGRKKNWLTAKLDNATNAELIEFGEEALKHFPAPDRHITDPEVLKEWIEARRKEFKSRQSTTITAAEVNAWIETLPIVEPL